MRRRRHHHVSQAFEHRAVRAPLTLSWTANWVPHAGPLIGYYLIAAFGAPYVILLAIASANTAGESLASAAERSKEVLGRVLGSRLSLSICSTPVLRNMGCNTGASAWVS